MEESLTNGVPQEVASQEPTTQPAEQSKADGNQETISTEQTTNSSSTQEAVSTAPAQIQKSGGEDDGLAKFAKGQGYTDEDIAGMTEREKKTLLSLKKNVDNFRNADKKLTEQVVEVVDSPRVDETEDESFKREFRQYKYEKQIDTFWSDDKTKRDRSLEPTMAKILKDKKAELIPLIGEDEAKKYCFNLSRDLNTLYTQALIETGAYSPEAAKEEARREERDSIKKQIAAAPDAAHAVQNSTTSQPKVTLDWVRTQYNSKDPEHVKLVNEFFGSKK